jgi:hypothetical protein
MRQLGIRIALTFNKHFTQVGFEQKPENKVLAKLLGGVDGGGSVLPCAVVSWQRTAQAAELSLQFGCLLALKPSDMRDH